MINIKGEIESLEKRLIRSMKEMQDYGEAASNNNQQRLNELAISSNRYRLKYFFEKSMVESQREDITRLKRRIAV